MVDCEPRGLNGGMQPVGGGEVAELGPVGPGKWIVEFSWRPGGDVPDGEPAPDDEHPACFVVEAGL